jgi:hypothetical protein
MKTKEVNTGEVPLVGAIGRGKLPDQEVLTKIVKVGITSQGAEDLARFVASVNASSKRRIKASFVLEYAVSKLADSDIVRIHERYYTANEKLEVLWERHNLQHPEHPLTKEEFLAMLLNAYEGRPSSKLQKPTRPDLKA